MDDYINRAAFIEAKEKQYCRNCDRRKNSKGQVVYEIGDAPCRACGIGYMLDDVEDFPAADVRPVRPCDGCPFCVCEKHGVICPSDPDFRCDTRGGANDG